MGWGETRRSRCALKKRETQVQCSVSPSMCHFKGEAEPRECGRPGLSKLPEESAGRNTAAIAKEISSIKWFSMKVVYLGAYKNDPESTAEKWRVLGNISSTSFHFKATTIIDRFKILCSAQKLILPISPRQNKITLDGSRTCCLLPEVHGGAFIAAAVLDTWVEQKSGVLLSWISSLLTEEDIVWMFMKWWLRKHHCCSIFVSICILERELWLYFKN